MKLTDNFNSKEFVKPGVSLTPVQLWLLEHHCEEILQPLRDFLKCSIKVTSGVRFPSDLNRLRKLGYTPSETSDHLYNTTVTLKNPKKIAKYGRFYSYSVGASDIIPSIGAKTAWSKLKPHFNKKDTAIELPNKYIKIGQIILEESKNKEWIHISNPYQLIYSDVFINQFLKKSAFLTYKNGQYHHAC